MWERAELPAGELASRGLTELWESGATVTRTVCVAARELASELMTDGDSEHGESGSRQFCSTEDMGQGQRGTWGARGKGGSPDGRSKTDVGNVIASI